jgi:signal transduction histidine kinase
LAAREPMNLNTRTLGLAVLLLLLFLGAAVALQAWLLRETRQLRAIAIDEQRERLGRIIALAGLPQERWDAYFQKELGVMIGGKVELRRAAGATAPAVEAPAAPGANGRNLTFTMPVAHAPGWEAHVAFATPALIRVQVLHQRILAAVVLLALLLAIVPLLAVVVTTRRGPLPEGATRSPWSAVHAQAVGMEQFARLSNERTVALAEEHAARSRAEQDLQVNRSLLDRSLAERARLGRELHDNICQTLYAVCLTLGSVRKKAELTPELAERMDQCLTELRRVNQEVRTYLQDLEPGNLNAQAFSTALASLIGSLPTGDEVQIERRLDAATVELIPSHQVAEIMNILREAVSNSLRHGRARNIVLRAGQNEQSIALSVQDDGVGFVQRDREGHGLGNMRARAMALGGNLAVESTPGRGTRVILTLPLPVVA